MASKNYEKRPEIIHWDSIDKPIAKFILDIGKSRTQTDKPEDIIPSILGGMYWGSNYEVPWRGKE